MGAGIVVGSDQKLRLIRVAQHHIAAAKASLFKRNKECNFTLKKDGKSRPFSLSKKAKPFPTYYGIAACCSARTVR